MKEIKSARCGYVVHKRDNKESEWVTTEYNSISLAKKANGCNAITIKTNSELPK